MTFTGDIRNVTNDTQFDNFNTSQIKNFKKSDISSKSITCISFT